MILFLDKKNFLIPCVFLLVLFSSNIYGQTQAQSILLSSSKMYTIQRVDTTWKPDKGDVRLRRAGLIVGAFGLAMVGAGIPLYISSMDPVGGDVVNFIPLFVSGVFLGSGCAMTIGGTSMFVVGEIKIRRDKKRYLSLNLTPTSAGFVYKF